MAKRREYRVAGQAEPIPHFTDAVRAGELLFVSGIVPVDAERQLVGGDDVVAQARAVFANMQDVLAAAGCTFADVVKVTVYLTDIRYRETVYRIMGRWLKGVYPVSTGLVVEALARPEWLVEIDATAVISESKDADK